MPKRAYTANKLCPKHLAIVGQANVIISEYAAQGYELTLRQLYYQFVSRDLLPNTQQNYKRLGNIINDARLAGLVDWDSITDRTRGLESLSTWTSPEKIIGAVAQQYRRDLWAGQPHRVEVWIEKEALAGVFERVCQELRVPYLSCRGYTSQSEMWRAAMRLRAHARNGQTPVILHFGDHDPSGMDMSRDIRDRMEVFGADVEFQRLALNMEQVEEYDPPPNPAKATDSRFQVYLEEFGDESWELDALEPDVLAGMVRDAVADLRDERLWEEALAQEQEEKRLLGAVRDDWENITRGL